jgi:hypothetical protein
MRKNIRTKLLKMDSEKLIELIDQLCDDKATEHKLSLLIAPSSKEIERAMSELDSLSDRYRNSPDSQYTFKKLCSAVEILFSVAENADSAAAAQIYYEMLESFRTNDLLEIYDDTLNDYYFCAKDELTQLLKCEEKTLPAETIEAYKQAVDFGYD